MTRLMALVVAGAVLALSAPAVADGMPRKPRATVAKKMTPKKAKPPPAILAPIPPPVAMAPPPAPPPPAPALVWVPGHWTWNSPMNTHVWVPGMYIEPPPPALASAMPLWRIGEWIGIGRRY